MVDYISMGAIPVYVGFCTDGKAFKKELKRLEIKDKCSFLNPKAAGTTHFFQDSEGRSTCIICVPKKPKGNPTKSQVIALIAHEVVHAWQECELQMNEKAAGHEIEAYNIQWILQCCLDIYYGEEL